MYNVQPFEQDILYKILIIYLYLITQEGAYKHDMFEQGNFLLKNIIFYEQTVAIS